MKFINKERVIISSFVFILLLIPNLYFMVNLLVKHIVFDTMIWVGLLEIIAYSLIILLFSNAMLHLIMESNFHIRWNHKGFIYKTLFKLQTIYIDNNSVKKILVCNEDLVLKGSYESIIVIRKGLKRNLFFTEFSMKKEAYFELKKNLTNIKPNRVVETNKKYVKPLYQLFSK